VRGVRSVRRGEVSGCGLTAAATPTGDLETGVWPRVPVLVVMVVRHWQRCCGDDDLRDLSSSGDASRGDEPRRRYPKPSPYIKPTLSAMGLHLGFWDL
jgi:hypothetical protein